MNKIRSKYVLRNNAKLVVEIYYVNHNSKRVGTTINIPLDEELNWYKVNVLIQEAQEALSEYQNRENEFDHIKVLD